MASQQAPSLPSSKQTYVDPLSSLEKLGKSLGQSGFIHSNDVSKLINFMKESQVLVSKCVVLNVLRATKTQSTLTKFMEGGGWTMLNMWLAEAKKTQNTPLLVELLLVLQNLPVTIAALKQGNMGKLIKQLSKQENPEVKKLSTEILAKWMTVFREGQAAKTSGKSVEGSEERRGSSSDNNESSSQKTSKSSTDNKKDKSEKKGGKKKAKGPPVEASQPPPGPLVALGKPKEKTLKRPRDVLFQKSGIPPEKKAKPSPVQDVKGSKGPIESEGFMNALAQSSQSMRAKEKKVKKLSKGPNKQSRTSSTGEPEPTTPTLSTTEGGEQSMEEEATAPSEQSLKKKRVSWAEQDNLVMIHYFEMDESERVNVNRPKSFLDAAQQEKMREREALEAGLWSRDRLIEMIPWGRPHPMEISDDLNVSKKGAESQQKEIQAERERKVLAQLFLSKTSLPPTPLEPDPEPDIVETEPKPIPLMEPNAMGSGPNGGPPPPFASPTHMGPPGNIPPEPLQSPGTTIHQAQSLINYYNESNNPGMPQYNHGGGGGGGGVPNVPPGGGGGGPNMSYPPSGPGEPNHYQYQQGFPPTHHDPSQGQWNQGPPPSHMQGGGSGYYGDQYYQGRGGPPVRRGRGMGFRGRGGFGMWRGMRGLESKICKHFITHGCKLGTRCKFLHCTPEELVNKMANNDHQQPQNLPPPPGSGGGRYRSSHSSYTDYIMDSNRSQSRSSPPSSSEAMDTTSTETVPPPHTVANDECGVEEEPQRT